MKKQALILYLGVILSMKPMSCQVLIFDVGGVFFALDKTGFGLSAVGDGSRLKGALLLGLYTILNRVNPMKEIKEKVFMVLSKIPLEQPQNFQGTYDELGNAIPYSLSAYQSGFIESNELRKLAQETCTTLSKHGAFLSSQEETMIRKIIDATLDPERIVQFYYALDATSILGFLAREKTEDGQKKHLLIALSNWDGGSFDQLAGRFADTVNYFDELCVSGKEGSLKPQEAAYAKAFAKAKIHNPAITKSECLFFDDQKENIEAAQSYGFTSFLLKTNDYASAEAALAQAGISLPEFPTSSK